MTPALVVLAAIAAAGGVVAVSAATPRLAALGMLVALIGSAYVADPLPGPFGLGARLVGTTLAAYLVWIALRRAPGAVPGTLLGWGAALAIAAAAFLAGWLAAGSLGAALSSGTGDGPGPGLGAAALAAGSPVARAALGAALALTALAAPPVILARDTLRLGFGLLLLLASAMLVWNAIGGARDGVIELSFATLTAVAGAGVAAVISAGLRRTGDLEIHDTLRRDPAIRHRPADEAHRLADEDPR